MNAHRTVVENRRVDMANSLELAYVSIDKQMSICEQMMRFVTIYSQGILQSFGGDDGRNYD